MNFILDMDERVIRHPHTNQIVAVLDNIEIQREVDYFNGRYFYGIREPIPLSERYKIRMSGEIIAWDVYNGKPESPQRAEASLVEPQALPPPLNVSVRLLEHKS